MTSSIRHVNSINLKSPFFSLIINIGVLFSSLLTAFSGFLLQVEYHLGNHGTTASKNHVFGIGYHDWSNIHKFSIVTLSLLMIFHTYLHWKWYRIVIKKRLIAKNKQVLTLSGIFLLVAMTGFIPWIIDFLDGSKMIWKGFIEIHDKLAIILTLYLILHVIKRLKWFLITFEKLKNKYSTQKV